MLGNVTDVKLEHPESMLSPMLVTLLGIAIDSRAEHELNAPNPILSSVLGNVTDVKLEQPVNAPFSILVTSSGITIVSRDEHP